MDMMEIRRRVMQPRRLKVVWNNFQPPFSTELYRAYNSSNTSIEDVSQNVVRMTWLKSGTLYQFSIRLKESYPDVTTEHIYYSSYMLCPSFSDARYGLNLAGGVTPYIGLTTSGVWVRASYVSQGRRDGSGICYYPYILNNGYIPVAGDSCLVKSPIYVDLTLMYGAGKEPTLEEFERQCVLNGINLEESQAQEVGTQCIWIT